MALKVGVEPATGFPKASSKVTVMEEVDVPSGSTGLEPVMDEVVMEGDPAVKFTVPPVSATGFTMARVFVSALVDFNEQVDTPVATDEVQFP